ncbi:FtsL-like putative cell division protein [Oscillatoria amoena NRMC-F 0135]|nr:FtsL-like putative cell division protein [Oscillatoria amoena NRMC-F 0135]
MADNTFKIEPSRKSKSSGLFSFIERRLRLENYLEEGFPVQHMPKVLFVMVLGVVYISNTHYADKTVRRINELQTEVEDLRADYTTTKADLMFASKQSEVARKVGQYGLKESLKPPYKITVHDNEY